MLISGAYVGCGFLFKHHNKEAYIEQVGGKKEWSN